MAVYVVVQQQSRKVFSMVFCMTSQSVVLNLKKIMSNEISLAS